MRYLATLFGRNEPRHPPLALLSPLARRIEPFQMSLEELSRKVSGHLEVVPAGAAVFVFAGNAPGKLDLIWVHDGHEDRLSRLAKENGAPGPGLQELRKDLREAHRTGLTAPRFSHAVGRKTVTVIDSEDLAASLEKIVRAVSS